MPPQTKPPNSESFRVWGAIPGQRHISPHVREMRDDAPQIVIVGGGFGGLAAAKAPKNTHARMILIDRANQPLLYPAATSVLSPGQIASPIRAVLGKFVNHHLPSEETQSLETPPGATLSVKGERG